MTSPIQKLDGISVRPYRDSDEKNWVNCRVQAFLDSSYRDDVQQYREEYENPSVRIVAVRDQDQQVLGFLDVEYCSEQGPETVETHGVLWHLGVLPDYRRLKLAHTMWEAAKLELKAAGVSRVQAWTQDDAAANLWYLRQGWKVTKSYLNVYVRGLMGESPLKDLLPGIDGVWKYGHIRNFNFEAPLEYRSELEKLSYRMHEVRVYEIEL